MNQTDSGPDLASHGDVIYFGWDEGLTVTFYTRKDFPTLLGTINSFELVVPGEADEDDIYERPIPGLGKPTIKRPSPRQLG